MQFVRVDAEASGHELISRFRGVFCHVIFQKRNPEISKLWAIFYFYFNAFVM